MDWLRSFWAARTPKAARTPLVPYDSFHTDLRRRGTHGICETLDHPIARVRHRPSIAGVGRPARGPVPGTVRARCRPQAEVDQESPSAAHRGPSKRRSPAACEPPAIGQADCLAVAWSNPIPVGTSRDPIQSRSGDPTLDRPARPTGFARPIAPQGLLIGSMALADAATFARISLGSGISPLSAR